jgi:hypothetical protein
MISDAELDRVLAAWLAEGPERGPADDVAAAMGRIDRTAQRRGLRGGRFVSARPSSGLWPVAAALVVVVVVGGIVATPGGRRSDPIGPSGTPGDGAAAGAGVAFGSNARIAGTWFTDDAMAFTAVLPPGIDPGASWRAVTFNAFTLQGWDQTDRGAIPVDAGAPLMAGTAEAPDDGLTTPVTITVHPEGFRGDELLTLGTAMSVDQPSTVNVTGEGGWFTSVELGSASGGYTVDARVLRLGDGDVVSGSRLRAAPEGYPTEVTALYTDVPPGTLGLEARHLLEQVRREAASSDPYDLATEIVTLLGDPSVYAYDTDVTDLDCTGISQVECFARSRRGYCLHYASTMAMLLRAASPENPIPTRLVEGFLPGTRVGDVETVMSSAAHAWVEVFFPGIGWVPFDPTGGAGRPVAVPGPSGG